MTNLSHYTTSGDVTILEFQDDYRAAEAVSAKPLESGDVAAIVALALSLAEEQHLLLPDAEILLERCVTSLLTGHLVLQGPPGTGKTSLAYVLAAAFNATVHLETATADWSTYDVVGGLHPSARGGMETLQPWLGHVPRAALECAAVIAKHEDPETDEPHQAHWLIIDEFNRAEIDKAIGPLYTILGGGGPTQPLPLWFADAAQREVVWLPQRFRIIATMNTVDTNYAYSFSQGLTRRFQFVYVGVPTKPQVMAELTAARTSAALWFLRNFGVGEDHNAVRHIVDDPRLTAATSALEDLLGSVRFDDLAKDRPGWPLGTAQLVDVYKQLMLRLPGAEADSDLDVTLDLAIADRIIPQASNLLTAQLDAIEGWLGSHSKFPRASTALRQLRFASATGY